MKIVKFIAGIRFVMLIPIIGLAVAAFVLFIEGGNELIHLLVKMFVEAAKTGAKSDIIVGIVEVIHLFLVGTVLFLTSLGLYQLFIHVLPLPGWLKMNNIEELELNLVGIVVVVLAVDYLSVIFEEQEINMAVYGVGYALPIVALAYFMKIRSEMRSSENGHVTAITEALSQAGETTQSPDKTRD
ncbi:MAG: YqhA family protein [Methanosarcina sp.]|nr:hypothetical protein BGV40_05635 [Methanosarcina sp. Ant1]